jgi:hypothetical protein
MVLQQIKHQKEVFAMYSLSQISMFSWENDAENLGDLKRLVFVLENLPDAELIRALKAERKNGRNDYPIRAMWNMLIAMIVFGHSRFADIIREMKRNAQLRAICGFTFAKTPSAANVSRFVRRLEAHPNELLKVFVSLADMLYELLPDFGENLAIDSKWTWSLANRRTGRKNPDRRSESCAAWGTKTYSGVHPGGREWHTEKRCFGFKVHLIVDTKYELPVAFIISDASGSDTRYGKKLLLQTEKERPHILRRCEYFTADKGYDDTELITYLKDKGIKAIIDKRHMWKEESERELIGYSGRYYNDYGEVFCYSKEFSEKHRMIPVGYDKERDALRFKCPASHYGCTCKESDSCTYARNIRVPLKTDVRIFTQIDRTGYKWKRLYKARTAVERVNSRLDVSFGFEQRRIRGSTRMTLFSVLSFAVMDAVALGCIKENRHERMRSLVRAA